MHSENKALFPGQPISTNPSAAVNTVALGCLLICRETALPSQRIKNQAVHGGQAEAPHQPWKWGGVVHRCHAGLLHLLIVA